MQLVLVDTKPDDIHGFITAACSHLLTWLNKPVIAVLLGYYPLTIPVVLSLFILLLSGHFF